MICSEEFLRTPGETFYNKPVNSHYIISLEKGSSRINSTDYFYLYLETVKDTILWRYSEKKNRDEDYNTLIHRID